MTDFEVKTTTQLIGEVIVNVLGVRAIEVLPSADLREDLGADDLDIVELVISLEDELEIEITDGIEQSWQTVGDIITYVQTHEKYAP